MDTNIGWRVEFRPMDICVTDFENSALTICVGMIANLVNAFDLDFVIPISLVDENMKRAHYRDALLEQKFWFKTSIFPNGSSSLDDYKTNDLESNNFAKSKTDQANRLQHPEEIKELYIWQILGGDPDAGFPKGLIYLFNEYMEVQGWSAEHKAETNKYLDFLLDKARGNLPTAARWIRNFVQSHPDYKKDSVVSEKTSCDLIRLLREANGPDSEVARGLLGKYA